MRFISYCLSLCLVLGGGVFSVEASQRGKSFPFHDGGSYGIDVSHYGGHINWPVVAKSSPKSVYIKASEGHTYLDAKFSYNITHARAEGLLVGPYHFMSAHANAEDQANHFIEVYKPHHRKGDLPPALDLEWDPARHSGNDRWKDVSAQDIATRVEKWLQMVEAAFGVQPIIYTNKSWWEGRIGSQGDNLKKYKFWIANYSHHGDSPPIMEGFNWTMWQFTGSGHIDGIDTVVDISLINPDQAITKAAATVQQKPFSIPAECKTAAPPLAESALSAEEMQEVFALVGAEFGDLSAEQTKFFDVLVNSSPPSRLRSFIAGKAAPILKGHEQRNFFLLSRSNLTDGHLTKRQVAVLNQLLGASNPSMVRDCILQ